MRAYEVFARFHRGEPLRHLGSVRSVDGEAALEAAVSIYLRRDAFERVWVVERGGVSEMVTDEEREKRRMAETEYRRPSYFTRRLASSGYRAAKLTLE